MNVANLVTIFRVLWLQFWCNYKPTRLTWDEDSCKHCYVQYLCDCNIEDIMKIAATMVWKKVFLKKQKAHAQLVSGYADGTEYLNTSPGNKRFQMFDIRLEWTFQLTRWRWVFELAGAEAGFTKWYFVGCDDTQWERNIPNKISTLTA